MMNDDQIVRLYWERDEQAIRETDEKYGKLCRRIARNILGDECDAEECVSDTYLGLWNAIPPAAPTDLKTFVCRIARNLSLKRLTYNHRRKRDTNRVILFSEIESALTDECVTPTDDPELGRLLNDFLRTEKEAARKVFLRRYFFSEGIGEIAARYGYSESKVKSMLFHTRTRLRKFLTEKGVYP